MNDDKFTIVNENNEEHIAEIITSFSYKGKEYIIYSVDMDNDNSNVYVSRLIKDSNGYDTICDIEDENERCEVIDVCNEILSSVS